MLAHKFLLLAKIESQYGVDPTPTPSANAYITTEPKIEYLEKSLERNQVSLGYGKLAPLKIGEGVKVTFATELTGSGALGTPPFVEILLRACNLTQTINSGVSVVYSENSSETGESITIWFYKDGHLHKVSGCLGTFKFPGTINEVARLEFEFTGLYGGVGAITDVTFPAMTYDTATPIIFKGAAAEINAVTEVFKEITFDIGNIISPRKDANASTGISRYWISQREVKGSFKIDTAALSTNNYYSLWANQSLVNFGFTIGQTSTKKCSIAMPRCSIELPAYGAEDNQLLTEANFIARPTTAGNDAVTITFI